MIRFFAGVCRFGNLKRRAKAADWTVRFHTGELDPKDKRQFRQWLNGKPENVELYREFATIWSDADLISAAEDVFLHGDADRPPEVEAGPVKKKSKNDSKLLALVVFGLAFGAVALASVENWPSLLRIYERVKQRSPC